MSFNAKVLPELPEDIQFIVEGSDGKDMGYWGPETTNLLASHWLQQPDCEVSC